VKILHMYEESTVALQNLHYQICFADMTDINNLFNPETLTYSSCACGADIVPLGLDPTTGEPIGAIWHNWFTLER
jgi:hypothetical protein